MPKKTKTSQAADDATGWKLRALRLRAHLSMRELARRAGVAVSYVSNVEAGRLSPTLATLRKMLLALGSDIGPFFGDGDAAATGHVFRRHAMRATSDAGRNYTFLLPARPDVRIEMMDEELFAGEKPDFESLAGDLAGYVLEGELLLEVEGNESQVLEPGDAFYVPAGHPVRGRCGRGKSVRLVSVELLPSAPGRKPRKRRT
jgi:transcriptional regulator with XRE-family HTH domain